MSYSKDLKTQITTAIAKAGVQQYNSIVYLLKTPNHRKIKHLNRLVRYENFLDCSQAKNIFNGL